MPSTHYHAVHAHAVCVRATFASYVISACAQGKTDACVREVALPWATCSNALLFRRAPPAPLMSCLHALEFTLWRRSLCPRPQPCVCVHVYVLTCSLVSNSYYMPLPACLFGHFLLHVHHFCERILHCNHCTFGRTALHCNHPRYSCTAARDIAVAVSLRNYNFWHSPAVSSS